MNRRPREEGSSPSVRDEILTTEEVCTLLKMKKATLYRHTSQVLHSQIFVSLDQPAR